MPQGVDHGKHGIQGNFNRDVQATRAEFAEIATCLTIQITLLLFTSSFAGIREII